jgi:hypothetical protein
MRSGWKRSKFSSFSPVEANRIGLPGDRLDRQRGAAARVAVELGHDDAVEVDGLGELLGHVDGVLAGHRVDDEQDRVRLDRATDVDELLHEHLVDVQAPDVSTISTSLPAIFAWSSAQRAISTGFSVVPFS